ncbi:hypothetical protein BH11BAC1_BH11BAC1_04520 [soil metagenome]
MHSKIFSLILFLFILSNQLYSQQVGHTQITFVDASRGNRSIQAEVYYPATAAGNNTPIAAGVFPIIVFGHGFVMTTSAYQNFWDDLVPEGYILALPSTEGGFAPVHADFGADLNFLVGEIQTNGAGASVPSTSVGNLSAIMGHSMGGGCSFLAAENNTSITTMVSFAAANTNPSSITAAQMVSVPTLVFSGANDCVAPPPTQQDLIYDSTSAAYKTQIYITGGSHCYFADYNFNCAFGEATCSPSPTITRAEQHDATSVFLKLWLAYYLKGECSKAQEFQDSLSSSPRITFRQSQPIACTTGIQQELNATDFSLHIFPNPAGDYLIIDVKRSAETDIAIYNMVGEKIKVNNFESQDAKNTLKIDVSGLKPGIYFVEVRELKKRWRGKFVWE